MRDDDNGGWDGEAPAAVWVWVWAWAWVWAFAWAFALNKELSTAVRLISHMITSLSSPADARNRPSCENLSAQTGPVCPDMTVVVAVAAPASSDVGLWIVVAAAAAAASLLLVKLTVVAVWFGDIVFCSVFGVDCSDDDTDDLISGE